jgi:transcriptional regulator CtsR
MAQSIAGQIEAYLKKLLMVQDYIELQRSELAEIFSCVPSQINYVLGTRFTPAQGYIVESRRGGGGYLKIVKLSWDDLSDYAAARLPETQQEALSQNEVEGILRRLLEEDWLTQREFQLLRMMLSREVLLGSAQAQDVQRTRLLQAALTALCRMDGR